MIIPKVLLTKQKKKSKINFALFIFDVKCLIIIVILISILTKNREKNLILNSLFEQGLSLFSILRFQFSFFNLIVRRIASNCTI